MAKRNLSQSPRAMRDSTNDPERWSPGEVETNAGDFDCDHASEVIKRQSDNYRQKYEAEGYGPRKR